LKYWVTSDNHWHHTNIIKYANRPFSTTEEMDRVMIENWNAVVSHEDIVFHLGDVGLFKNEESAEKVIKQLNGVKILIFGNHDRKKWDWRKIGFTVAQKGPFQLNDYLLTHKPLQWHQNKKGLFNLHGHIHDKDSQYSWQMNLSVEKTGYTPVLLELMKGGKYEKRT